MVNSGGKIKNTIGNFDNYGTIYEESINKNGNFLSRNVLGYPILAIGWIVYLRRLNIDINDVNSGKINPKTYRNALNFYKLGAKTGNKFLLQAYGSLLIEYPGIDEKFYEKINKGKKNTSNKDGIIHLLKARKMGRKSDTIYNYYDSIEKNSELSFYYAMEDFKNNVTGVANALGEAYRWGHGVEKNEKGNEIAKKYYRYQMDYIQQLNLGSILLEDITSEKEEVENITTLKEIQKLSIYSYKKGIFKKTVQEHIYRLKYLTNIYYQYIIQLSKTNIKTLNEKYNLSIKYIDFINNLQKTYVEEKKFHWAEYIIYDKIFVLTYCYILYYNYFSEKDDIEKDQEKTKNIMKKIDENIFTYEGEKFMRFKKYKKMKTHFADYQKAYDNKNEVEMKNLIDSGIFEVELVNLKDAVEELEKEIAEESNAN
jgi:hypothetical protein